MTDSVFATECPWVAKWKMRSLVSDEWTEAFPPTLSMASTTIEQPLLFMVAAGADLRHHGHGKPYHKTAHLRGVTVLPSDDGSSMALSWLLAAGVPEKHYSNQAMVKLGPSKELRALWIS